MNGYDSANLVYLVLLLAVLLLWLVPMIKREGFGRSVKMALGWVAIFVVLVFVVVEWERFRGAIDPSYAVVNGEEFRVRSREDGHFYIRGAVNGVPTTWLVDSGASDIVLTMETARAAGWPEERLSFDGMASTANGMVRIAGARIDELEVGPITVENQVVSVNGGRLDDNLLGMTFLNQLSGWRVENGELILTP